jgi:hypothetical protein
MLARIRHAKADRDFVKEKRPFAASKASPVRSGASVRPS